MKTFLGRFVPFPALEPEGSGIIKNVAYLSVTRSYRSDPGFRRSAIHEARWILPSSLLRGYY